MATIHDVAERAGVSVTTVSRVLNNRGYISDKTRQNVYKIMEELNYQPNELARSLLRKQSNVIGLIVPDIAHPFFSELAKSVESAAYDNGCKLLLCNSQLDPVKEKEYIDMMKRNRVDGIIMGSHTLDVDVYRDLSYPIVTLDRRIDGIPFVASDNAHGGELAAKLLIGKGCKKIVHLCGNLQLDLLANLRTESFVRTVREAGAECTVLQTSMNVFDQKEYENLIISLFDAHIEVDAIFATSDIIAAFAVKWCRKLKLDVPRQVKIVGYDDVATAAWLHPELTTVRQPIEDMGRAAFELLRRQINEEPWELANVLPVELIERETT